LSGRRQSGGPAEEHLPQVLARMPRTREEQGDRISIGNGHDAGRENAVALGIVFAEGLAAGLFVLLAAAGDWTISPARTAGGRRWSGAASGWSAAWTAGG